MKKLVFALALAGSLGAMSAYAAADLVITQQDKQFSKDDVSLSLGDAIVFTNDDTVTHSISVKAPDGTTKVGVVEKPGEKVRADFDTAGDWRVICLVHPKMKMAVHVH